MDHTCPVVGGGSAACAPARRLSGDPLNGVGRVEAGCSDGGLPVRCPAALALTVPPRLRDYDHRVTGR